MGQRNCHNTLAPGLTNKSGRRSCPSGGLSTTERGTAVNREDLSAIWTPGDFRDMVMAIRAVPAPELASIAPVIDIKSRERLA